MPQKPVNGGGPSATTGSRFAVPLGWLNRATEARRLSLRDRTAGPERERPMPQYVQPRTNWLLRFFLCAILVVACFVYGYGFSLYAPYLMLPFAGPLAILAMIAIWALPQGDYAPISLLNGLFFAFFAVTFLWPDYLAVDLPGLPWLTLRRIVGFPLALTLLICVSVSGDFRAQIKNSLGADRVITSAMIIFLVIQTLSIGLSSSIGSSINKWIVAQTNWTSVFFVGCYIFQKKRLVDRWAKMLLVLGAIVCFFGVWESALGHAPWVGHIPSFLQIEDTSVLRSLAGTVRGGERRVTSTFGTPLGLAEFLSLSMPFALHYAIGPNSRPLRVAAGLYIVAAFYVIVATGSRLGVVACLLTMMLYLFVWALSKWRNEPSSILAPAIVLAYPALFSLAVASTAFVHRIRVKVWGGADGNQDASNQGRKDQFIAAVPKIIKRPIGYGVGQGGETLQFKIPDGSLTIDSYYLSVILEYGILGFIVYYTIFIRAAWVGGKFALAESDDEEFKLLFPIAISLVSFVVIKSVFSQEDGHTLPFMLISATLALSARANARAHERSKQGQGPTAVPRAKMTMIGY
jgi:hypothetical protein